jgi:hypothetical protein
LYSNNLLTIDDKFEYSNSLNYIYYTNKKYNYITDILNDNSLKVLKKAHKGAVKGPFYTKIDIKNISKNKKNIVIYNPIDYVKNIDVEIYKNQKLFKTYKLGFDTLPKDKIFNSKRALFEVILEPNQQYTIISKNENFLLYNLGWEIYEKNNFIKTDLLETMFWGILVGSLIILSILLIISAKLSNLKSMYVLALFCISVALYHLNINGFLYYFFAVENINFYYEAIFIFGSFCFILSLLLPLYIFELNEKHKKLSIMIKVFIAYQILVTTISTYSIIQNNQDLIVAMIDIYSIAVIIILISMLIFAFYMKKLDKVGSDHYIRAQLMGTIGYSLYLIAGFNTFDILSFDKLYIFLLPILTIIEITYLLLTQYNYIKSKYIKLQNYKNHITEHAKFLSIGQSLSHIMHQWKQPLTQFGTSILLLKTIQKFDKNRLNSILLEELPK